MVNSRPAGKVHPAEFDGYSIKENPFPNRFQSLSAYDGLTDESDMAEYAWAFLRRNRYYQRMCDAEPADRRDFQGVWGYRDETAGGDRSWGLLRIKPFREKWSQGEPPLWESLAPFLHHLQMSGGRLNMFPKEIENPERDFVVVFSIADDFGPGISSLDAQLAIAERYLRKQWLKRSRPGKLPIEDLPKPSSESPAKLRELLVISDLSQTERCRTLEDLARILSDQGYWEAKKRSRHSNRARASAIDPVVAGAGGARIFSGDSAEDLADYAAANQVGGWVKILSRMCPVAYSLIYEWRMLGLLARRDWRRVLDDSISGATSISANSDEADKGVQGESKQSNTATANTKKGDLLALHKQVWGRMKK